jgi:hypothetical protein
MPVGRGAGGLYCEWPIAIIAKSKKKNILYFMNGQKIKLKGF